MTTNTDKAAGWVPYSIPLETAQRWVTNWTDQNPDKPLDPKDMRAFVVRRADFVELLAQHDTEFIRMYIGRKEELGAGQMQPCLVLVSAARQGDVDPKAPNPDLIIDLIGTRPVETAGSTVEETYNVFDFSRPCPPDCDPQSPLFIGESDERCQ